MPPKKAIDDYRQRLQKRKQNEIKEKEIVHDIVKKDLMRKLKLKEYNDKFKKNAKPFECKYCNMTMNYFSKYLHLKSTSHKQNQKIYELTRQIEIGSDTEQEIHNEIITKLEEKDVSDFEVEDNFNLSDSGNDADSDDTDSS